jgi:hypothetical protein
LRRAATGPIPVARVERDPQLARCVGYDLGRGEHEPVLLRHGVAGVGQILNRVSSTSVGDWSGGCGEIATSVAPASQDVRERAL